MRVWFVLSAMWRELNGDRRQLAYLASVQVQRESFYLIFIYHFFFAFLYTFCLYMRPRL